MSKRSKSCPGTLTEGTRHRCGKGVRPEHRPVFSKKRGDPARGCLVEAVGVWPFRTRVKRRKAPKVGKLASSSEAQYLSWPWAYWRRDGHEISWSYLVRSDGLRASGRLEVNES